LSNVIYEWLFGEAPRGPRKLGMTSASGDLLANSGSGAAESD